MEMITHAKSSTKTLVMCEVHIDMLMMIDSECLWNQCY